MKLRILGGLLLALVTTFAHSASLVVLPQQLVVDSGGEVRSGAKLFVYAAGSTTPLTVYETSAISALDTHTNPVLSTADGLFPAIYLAPSVSTYKLVLKDANDVTLYTEDNIPASPSGPYPQTANETAAGVSAVDLDYPEGHSKRYGATCDGVADDTAEIQAAFNVVSENGSTATVQAGTCLVDALTLDASNVTIQGEGNGSVLKASSDIPASGAIITSLAGGADESTNQALLDGIYGTDVVLVRSNVPNSVENVKIRNIRFEGNSVAARGVWLVGFTRGCAIENSSFTNFDGAAIVINGSWSFSLLSNVIEGDGSNGIGMHLGISGNGERAGAVGVNAASIVGNTINSNLNGVIWNIGSGLLFAGNTVEQNAADGFDSQSGNGATIVGNYFEGNDGDNMQIGGTNGTDFFEGCQIIGNHFAQETGNNIRLQGTQRCRIGPNYVSGTVTQYYFINSSGSIGQYVLSNEIWVPDVSATYISNSSELDQTDNVVFRTAAAAQRFDAPRLRAVAELTTNSTALIGFYGVTAVDKPDAVTAPTGGATTDAEARTAINTVITRLEELGLLTPN